MDRDPIENKVRQIEILVGEAANVARTYHMRRVGAEHLLYVIAGTEHGRRVIEALEGNARRIRLFLEKSFAEMADHEVTGGTLLTDDIRFVTTRPIRRAREVAVAPDIQDVLREMIRLGHRSPLLCQALVVGGVINATPGRVEENFFLGEDFEETTESPDKDVEGDIDAIGRFVGDGPGDRVDFVIPEEGLEDRHPDSGAPGESGEDSGESEDCEHMKAVRQATRNLSELARKNRLDDVIGRETEIARILETLSKRKRSNVLLSGEPGVGKTALAEGLARHLAGAFAPAALAGRPVLEISLSDLVAGARFRGDFEARMQKLIEMAHRSRAILFIDEIHLMIGAGSASARGGMDVANILKPALARGDITVIGATTPSELREIRRDGALMRRFDAMTVCEPSAEKVRRIIDEAIGNYVLHHEIAFEDEMLDMVVDLSDRYLPASRFPDKAFNVIDTACVIAAQRGVDRVDGSDVRRAVERNGGPRLTRPEADMVARISTLETTLSSGVLGQQEAAGALARAVRTSALGMNQGGVSGSYLFNGPTGVGKTEMARVFADAMNLPLVRIDMSEFMERHSVSGLIGAPPGYVGHDRDGILIDAADRHDGMVLLFDEAEKAHPDVHDILLQVLDNGSVRSADGRVVSLARAHVILSANIGARDAERASVGFGRTTDEKEVSREAVEQVFRREMIGRIRNRIQFSRPDAGVLRKIVEKEMRLSARKFADRGIHVEFDESLTDFLVDDRRLSNGVREIQDRILTSVHDPLAAFLLENPGTGAHVRLVGGEVVIGPAVVG